MGVTVGTEVGCDYGYGVALDLYVDDGVAVDHIPLVGLVDNNASMVKQERPDWICSGVVGLSRLYSEACGENCMSQNMSSAGLWSKVYSSSDPKIAGNCRHSCSLLPGELLSRSVVCPGWPLC